MPYHMITQQALRQVSMMNCLENPHKPLYGGGIISNPELNAGMEGWHEFGEAKIEHREISGNKFIVAHGRNLPTDSISQKVYLQNQMLYSFSAWVQVSEGNEPVTAVFKTETGFKHAAAVVAESKCWSMLKGGFTSDASGPAELYFESKNTSVEIWVDSISLQPFTQEEWTSHQDQSIQKIRKANVRIQAVDKQGNPLPNATVSMGLRRPGFPIGCAINKNILTNPAYQNWFTSRFTVTTFEDEMKWYSTEGSPGHEDYSSADALLNFAKKHGIAVRGHNVVWDDPRYQPGWIYSLTPTPLRKAVVKRINSVMSRYRGQLMAWDVVNENLHFSFFESKIGKQASAWFYKLAYETDRNVPLFMNDFNTIEDSRDGASTPAKYLKKLREIQAFRGNGYAKMGIGLEAHFSYVPNLPYMRASIDTLAATGLPIWLTELDVQSNLDQAKYLEQIMLEAHSHPKVNGIVIWAAWKPQGCYRMCLTDENFRNLPTGDVVDRLLHQWGSKAALIGSTDSDGYFEASLFHGDYEVNITHPSSLADHSFTVVSINESQQFPLILQVSCLAAPERAHYGGGILVNPEFNQGIEGWTFSGKAAITEGFSEGGNRFIVVNNRTHSLDSLSQTVQLQKGNFYTFSAWIQLSKASEKIAVVFKTSDGELIRGGETIAKQGCWSLLKGGIVAKFSTPVEILLESNNTSVEIWVDNISLQPFTAKQWRSHQEKGIEMVRKSKVKFQVKYANKTAADGALISIEQIMPDFPFGCGMNHHILTSTGYQDWFASRFKVTSFTNEMKWYSTEKKQGEENYTIADSMVNFCKQNGISIRGHNILWDNPKMQPQWVIRDLSSPDELRKAATQRLNSVVSRYAGQLTGWDVMNENLHFRFFEDQLGENATSVFYSMAYFLDPEATLFMNEYNTIENSQEQVANAANYKKKLEEILSFPGNEGVKAAIGLEGHFRSAQPNIAYMRSTLDVLGTMGLPIWLTEVDVDKGPYQAEYLEDILREGFSHPAVEGIIVFGGPEIAGFDVTLADSEFRPTPIGEVVDKLINEWNTGTRQVRADSRGFSEASLFHGDYKAKIYHPVTNSSTSISFKVAKETKHTTVLLQIDD
ncbi:Glycoside hydrolase, family 10 [Corchorus capsularis]|uniref:Glycoside hydrolase, family 10 n=1 Tax=Corchorus capsularis TaxID=210143 RepID=A0A1R3HU87_COCAP|nr:Glycoside hydrolase, family 10 [Corchorus capsularis]